MAILHSPRIVTDGLVFYYDMNNTKKSFIGAPTTNQFTLPTADVNGFGVQNSTFTRVRSGTFGGYEIRPEDYVWRYNISGNDCPYHGWDISTTIGTVVVFSFDYYVDPTASNYPSTNYIANIENAGFGAAGNVTDPTPSIKGVWKRGTIVATASATGAARCLLYPGGCGTRLADSGFILYKNPQVEFNPAGSVPTAFVANTRTETQSLLDLTGRNTITSSSLTYNANGSFSFNGSTNYLTLSNNLFNSSLPEFTISTWFYKNSSGILIGNHYHNSTWESTWFDTGQFIVNGANNNTTNRQILSFTTPANGSWHNLVAVNSNSQGFMKVYLNGVEIATRSATVTPWNSSILPTIGAQRLVTDNSLIGPINAQIATMQIHNRALSAAEVNVNFNALRGRFGI